MLLIGGEENITESPHPTEDNYTICQAPCPREGHTNCVVRWRKGAGFSNAFSKLKTCFGCVEALHDAYWFAFDAKKRGADA